MSRIDFSDPKSVNWAIAKYISRKSGKDARELIKKFKRTGFMSNEELIKAFNGSLLVSVSGNVTDIQTQQIQSNDAQILSYKTQAIKDTALLDDILIKSPEVYLDHGCGSGKITSEIAQLLGTDTVYGVDIYLHPLLEQRSIHGIIPDEYGGIKLSDNSVDIITCLLSLHHVILQDITLKELFRVLRPGGQLLIYEHDFPEIDTPEYHGFRLFLDAVHMTFSLYGTENESETSAPSAETQAKKLTLESEQWIFDAHYKSKIAWRRDLEACGFRHIRDSEFPNTQRMYFALFEK